MGLIQQPKVYIICGPTCTGKTRLAIELAKKFNGEVISADSRQVVKKMDVGTGKIPSDLSYDVLQDHYLIEGVKVYGYDLSDINQTFSSYQFAMYAISQSKNILSRNKNVFVVGGTGFYLDALTNRIQLNVDAPNAQLRSEISELSHEQLLAEIRTIDETSLEKVDKKNPVRLRRLLEKLKSPPKTLETEKLDARFVWIGLNGPRELLYSRADSWVDYIWNNGLLTETQHFIEKGFSENLKLNGLIYKQAKEFILGGISEKEALQLIKFSMHAYIRRQLIWFRKNAEIQWFDISEDNFSTKVYNLING